MYKKMYNCQCSPPTTNMYFKKKLHNCQLPPPTTNMFKKMHNCQPNGATTNNKDVPEISPLSMLTSNNKTCRGKSTIGVIKLKHQDFIPPQLVFFSFSFSSLILMKISLETTYYGKNSTFFYFFKFIFSVLNFRQLLQQS